MRPACQQCCVNIQTQLSCRFGAQTWGGGGINGAYVPVMERQSVSWGELRGVLHVLLKRRLGGRLVVVLGSEYVHKGILE